jgi:hypothetical protein
MRAVPPEPRWAALGGVLGRNAYASMFDDERSLRSCLASTHRAPATSPILKRALTLRLDAILLVGARERDEESAVRALEALVAVGRPAQERSLERLLAVGADDLVGRLGIVGLRHRPRIAAGSSSTVSL